MKRWRLTVMGAIAIWGCAVSLGMGQVWKHTFTPGEAGAAPKSWPVGTSIPANRSGLTLLLFGHPCCPCTSQSIEELAGVLSGANPSARTYVFFLTPNGEAGPWVTSAARERAEAIPGVTVRSDPDGAEARRFGVEASGHVLVFNAGGQLRFSGGITAGRGHAGPNPGCAALGALLAGSAGPFETTPVFGCPLFNPDTARPGERSDR